MLVQILVGFIHQLVHSLLGVVQTVRLVQNANCLLDQNGVRGLHLQDLQQSLFGWSRPVLQMVDHHQSYLALVDVLTIVPLCFYHLFALQIYYVVLNLEGHPQILYELTQNFLLGWRGTHIGTTHPGCESSQNSCFLSSHLKVVRFLGILLLQLVDVVPGDVPGLPDMQLNSLLKVDLHQFHLEFWGVVGRVEDCQHGGEVHEIASVDADINTIQLMYAFLVPPNRGIIFNIVDYQTAVVDYLGQSRQFKDFAARLPIKFGDDHGKDWPPSFASPIEEVPDGFSEGVGETIKVIAVMSEPLVGGERGQTWLCIFPGDHLFHDMRLFKFFGINLEDFSDMGPLLLGGEACRGNESFGKEFKGRCQELMHVIKWSGEINVQKI